MWVPDELQALCERVSWPRGEARVGPAREAQLARAEGRLGLRFPTQFRQFLGYLNGPCIGAGGVFGVETVRESLDLRRVLDAYPSWSAKGWLPVAGDGCGNYYVMVVRSMDEAPVGFVDTMASPDEIAYVVASDFWHFLSFYLRKDLRETAWPFEREEVVRDDPNIVRCKIAPMPWE